MKSNPYFNQLPDNYLFTEISARVRIFREQHPEAQLLNFGIGDVTQPLVPAVTDAMHAAVDDLTHRNSFRGYGPEDGYSFLKQAVIQNDYLPLGIQLHENEVFISDGAGSDLGNLSELFTADNRVAILNPAYPAYLDTCVMAGRAGTLLENQWSRIICLDCTADNNFIPELPAGQADIIYLCFPNNPTGTTLTRSQLQMWVDYALTHHSIIIFDGAYEAYISDKDVPHSIYEIPGAKEVAIEIRSYSKSAGFTGVRCGYTIVPEATGLRSMWMRRQCTKYNGTSYVAQRAAEATYTPLAKQQLAQQINYYKQGALLLRNGLEQLGYNAYGGINSPYVWVKTDTDSWTFFNRLLQQCQVVCTPGVGFGSEGDGYVRFSAFAGYDQCQLALQQIKQL